MLILKAPAKINWFLHVHELRKDGFHEIQSLMQKVALFDTLTFSPAKALRLETESEIPVEENLVYKAARILKNKYHIEAGALIHLEKNIPMGAGLGGGSSDAAAALTGLNELWSLNLSVKDLCTVAEQLGSDVPFFLHGPLSFASGRGETLTGCIAEKKLNVLLVKPSFNISTAWAYQELAAERSLLIAGEQGLGKGCNSELTKKARKVNNIKHFIRNFEKAELDGINCIVSNDLESVVIRNFPLIAEVKDRMKSAGAVLSLMSGSGSTVFGVFETHEKAENAAGNFNGFWTTVTETIIDES